MLLVQQLLQSFVNYLIQLLHLIDEYVIIDCGDNATTAMLCEVTEEIKNITEHDSELTDEKLGTTPEKGRVWRWRNSNSNSRKNTEGPVLRATVKPVKRFIPEVNSTGANSKVLCCYDIMLHNVQPVASGSTRSLWHFCGFPAFLALTL